MKRLQQQRVVKSGFVMLLTLLSAWIGQAAPVQLTPQVINLPAGAGMPIMGDIDGDGRLDLLVIDQSENKLLTYHQGADGFASTPDETPLPPQTSWVALADVDAHPGMELLMSTATGLVYSRQNGGRFEAERHMLIEANQVFTNNSHPILITLNTNKAGTNDLIPVISAEQTVLYHRDANYVWSPDPPVALTAKHTDFSLLPEHRRNPWSAGENLAHGLSIQQSYHARPEEKDDQKPENEAIRKIYEDMKKNSPEAEVTMDHIDVDGDGRKDVVLWQVNGKWDFRTDLYIFLRGADGKLPDRPTQALHGRGLPIPLGNESFWSPMGDLNGDGGCELVLLDLKTSATSVSGALETAISHGLDWALTVRSFRHGGFPGGAEASVPLTMILPAEILNGWPIFIKGDFNGDGRPDMLSRRTETQWNIFLSTTNGNWFESQPAITFETPAQGYIVVKDVNGDGLADILWFEPGNNRVSIFISPANLAKGKKP